MPKWASTLVKVAVTVGGLAYIVSQVDLSAAVGQLLGADPRWLLVTFLLTLSSLVVRAFRWYLLLRGLGISLPFSRLVQLYFVGHFFNAFLPTSFGGDVMRVLETSRHVPANVAAGTVLLDRLTGLLTLFLLALLALPWRPASLPSTQMALILALSLLGLIAGGVLLEGSLVYRIGRYLPGKLSPTGNGPVARLLQAIHAMEPSALGAALLISLFFNLIQVAWWWSGAQALGYTLSPTYLILVIPLLSISLLVPAIGGFGARETVATTLFDGARIAAGAGALPAGTGLALSTLIYLLERFSGLPGGPLYLWSSLRKPAIAGMEEENGR